jgi:hypothetical protein
MRKIYSIIILCTIFINCSKDDNKQTESIDFPTIENLSINNASIGDEITISGINLKPNEIYIIQFNEKKGLITEITETYIKVQIPEGATSGDITLTYNGTTQIIGNISISPRLYAFKYDEMEGVIPSIVKINPINGNETTIATFSNDVSFESVSFNDELNQFYGVYDNKLFVVEISDGTYTVVNLDINSDINIYELIIDKENNLYAFKYDEMEGVIPSIVKINPINGNETTIATFSNDVSFESVSFNDELNQFYGVYDNKLFVVEISDGTYTVVNLDINSDINIYELIIDKENNLYAFKYDEMEGVIPSIVKINPINGNETTIATFSNDVSFESVSFNDELNQFYGVYDNKLFVVEISDGTYTVVNLDINSDINIYELIITN